MSDFSIFLRFQMSFLIRLHLIFVLPLYMIFLFVPYEVESLEYFMIGAILLFQFVIYKEKSYKNSIHNLCRDYLQRVNEKTPSKSEISVFQNKVASLRSVAVGLTVLSIFIVMIIFQRL